jgi:predicted RNA binding protein with dsRBD fold (UPF0201 family)
MSDPYVIAWTPVHPTESMDRVIAAVQELFPASVCTPVGGGLIARGRSLAHLSEHLHQQRILDTARSAIDVDAADRHLHFQLNKQAATVDLLNFAVGSPPELGLIDVVVYLPAGGAAALLDVVAPPTADGVPLTDTSETE